MATYEELAAAILDEMAVAVLRRIGPEAYVMAGKPPDFYDEFFPPSESGHCLTPWKHTEDLESFFCEAEDFFKHGSLGSHLRPPWSVTSVSGKPLPIAVRAMNVLEQQIIIFHALGPEYPVKRCILERTRRNLLEQRRLHKDLREYKKRSRTDFLTGLHNKAVFNEILHDCIHWARLNSTPLSLIFFDIDGFKAVNDIYGHLAGDVVLAEIGRLFRSQVRISDFPCRYGGEEFAVITPETDKCQAMQLAEKLRENIAGLKFKNLPGVTVSAGVSGYIPCEDADSFMDRADKALYEAKRKGKNRVCVK